MTDELGQRVANLRRRKGMTQTELGRAVGVDPSFLSLVEKGKRRPGEKVMRALAAQLGSSVEHLTKGASGRDGDLRTVELDLRFAEVTLRSGDPATARDRFAAAHQQAVAMGDAYAAEQCEALYGLARADEALGNLDAAIASFEALLVADDLPSSVNRVTVQMWLCRTYTQVGELGRAIDLGEAALASIGPLDAPGAVVSDQTVELASTLVAAYFERGDMTRANVLITSVMTAAETRGSMRARGAAYWEAAIVAEARGEVRLALRYTERALALYGEIGNARAAATLRGNVAAFAIRLPGADLAAAEGQLLDSLREMAAVEASPADMAAQERELARCYLLAGRADDAVTTATQALGRVELGVPLERARVQAVLAAALLAAGDEREALTAYEDAASSLAAAGARRQSAPAWRELASVLKAMGRLEEAFAALEQAATVAGIPEVPISPATVIRT